MKKLILHLDDHELLAEGFRKLIIPKLTPCDYIHFLNPDQVLSAIKYYFENGKAIDAIVTDYNHPGLNGFEFARQVRYLEIRHGYDRTPIILFTMVNEEYETIRDGLRDKTFTAYFSKATSKETLLAYFGGLPNSRGPVHSNLRDCVVKIQSQEQYWIRWLYTESIYCNILEGLPDVESGERSLDRLNEIVKVLYGSANVFVHNRHKIGVEVLPIRGSIACIENGVRRGVIIWYDEGKENVTENLKKVVEEVNFEKITREYFL